MLQRTRRNPTAPAPDAAAPRASAPPDVSRHIGNQVRLRQLETSPGAPLDAATRAYFEPRFAHNFGRVRVHTDARAAASARELDAAAYAHGRDIVFGAGRFAPSSPDGRALLGHELAHVVQADRAATHPVPSSSASAGLEHEAQHAAAAIASGDAVPPLRASAGGLAVPLRQGHDGPGKATFGNLHPEDIPNESAVRRRVQLVEKDGVWYEVRGKLIRADGTYAFVIQDADKIFAVKALGRGRCGSAATSTRLRAAASNTPAPSRSAPARRNAARCWRGRMPRATTGRRGYMPSERACRWTGIQPLADAPRAKTQLPVHQPGPGEVIGSLAQPRRRKWTKRGGTEEGGPARQGRRPVRSTVKPPSARIRAAGRRRPQCRGRRAELEGEIARTEGTVVKTMRVASKLGTALHVARLSAPLDIVGQWADVMIAFFGNIAEAKERLRQASPLARIWRGNGREHARVHAPSEATRMLGLSRPVAQHRRAGRGLQRRAPPGHAGGPRRRLEGRRPAWRGRAQSIAAGRIRARAGEGAHHRPQFPTLDDVVEFQEARSKSINDELIGCGARQERSAAPGGRPTSS